MKMGVETNYKMKRIINKLLENELSKTAIIYTVSTFCNSATPFLLLPILTRYLTTAEYGIISMFTVITGFLLPFMGMSISAAVMRKFADNNEEESKIYLFNCLVVALVATIVVILFFELFADSISKWIGIPITLFPYIYIYVISTYIFNLTLSIFQIKIRVKEYAVYQNMCTVLNLIMSLLFVIWLRLGLVGRIYGLVISKLVFALLGIFYIAKSIGIRKKFNKHYIVDELLTFGLPMIPTEVKSTVLTCTDRIFITNMISISETGIYSVGNQISTPILLLAQAFNLAYVPWLYKMLNKNNKQEKKKTVIFTYVYFIGILFIALIWTAISKPIINLVTGDAYANASQYVIWLSLGYAFTGMHMMVVNYIYYVKRLKAYSIITISVIIINIVLNYILMKISGAVGAAQATLISNIVSFGLTWVLSAHVCKMPWFSFWKK